MRWSLDQAMAHWRSEKLITSKQESELRKSLEDAEDELPSRAIRVFAGVGAILIGLGVILFVASNWQELGAHFKTALLLIAMLASGGVGYWLAFERGDYRMTCMGLLFVNVMIFGATIFLVGQIYHLPLNFWWGMVLWFAGTVFLAYVLESRMHIWLAVPLLVLAVGWFRARFVQGFDEFGSLFDPEVNLLGMLPAIGVLLLSLGVLHRKSERLTFGEDILFYWGLFLMLIPLVVSTAAREAFLIVMRYPMDTVGLIALGIAVVALVCAAAFGEFRTKQGRWALVALPLYLVIAYVLAYIPVWMGLPQDASMYSLGENLAAAISGLHILHIILVFILLLTIVWEGTLLRLSGMINMGIIGIGITVIIQYFSWVFELLDRSVAFILGGLVILAVSAALERKRRLLLASVKTR